MIDVTEYAFILLNDVLTEYKGLIVCAGRDWPEYLTTLELLSECGAFIASGGCCGTACALNSNRDKYAEVFTWATMNESVLCADYLLKHFWDRKLSLRWTHYPFIMREWLYKNLLPTEELPVGCGRGIQNGYRGW